MQLPLRCQVLLLQGNIRELGWGFPFLQSSTLAYLNRSVLLASFLLALKSNCFLNGKFKFCAVKPSPTWQLRENMERNKIPFELDFTCFVVFVQGSESIVLLTGLFLSLASNSFEGHSCNFKFLQCSKCLHVNITGFLCNPMCFILCVYNILPRRGPTVKVVGGPKKTKNPSRAPPQRESNGRKGFLDPYSVRNSKF